MYIVSNITKIQRLFWIYLLDFNLIASCVKILILKRVFKPNEGLKLFDIKEVYYYSIESTSSFTSLA